MTSPRRGISYLNVIELYDVNWKLLFTCLLQSSGPTSRRCVLGTASLILLVGTTVIRTSSAIPVSFPSKTAHHVFTSSVKGSYFFSYDTGPGDHQSFREERRSADGTVAGSYGYVDPDGTLRITEYVADKEGYRASLEVFEPVVKFPVGRPLIVGPLPPNFRSSSEIIRDRKKESVFDKYRFPIEPFESGKVRLPPTLELSTKTPLSIVTSTPLDAQEMDSAEKPKNTETDEDSISSSLIDDMMKLLTEIPFPDVDILQLQKQLSKMAEELEEDSLLLIGPIPETLQNSEENSFFPFSSNSLNPQRIVDQFRQSRNDTSKANTLKQREGTRLLRSPFSKFLGAGISSVKANQTLLSTFSEISNNFDSMNNFSFEKVSLSDSELNFLQKEGLQIDGKNSSFKSIPSSFLLQGDYVPVNEFRDKISSPPKKIKVKKRKLKMEDKLGLEPLSFDGDFLQLDTSTNKEKDEIPTHDDKTMKVLSFQAQNIFRELMKIPKTKYDLSLTNSNFLKPKISQAQVNQIQKGIMGKEI